MAGTAWGPRIFVPPPLVFIGGWGAAWALAAWAPFEIDATGVSTAQMVIAIGAGVGGLGLMYWALATFVRARTPVLPMRPARLVVTEGPFRYTRNPMYLGLTAAYVGLALFSNQAWPLVVLPVVLIVLTFFVVRREEQHLREAFAEAYERYCQGVRRWL